MLVLFLSIILTTIGLAMVSVTRASARSMGGSRDWAEAQSLAYSGLDHALAAITGNNWRTALNGQTIAKPLGRGTFSYQVTDEVNGSLTANPTAPFTVFSTGAVGNSSFCLRAHLTTQSDPISYGATAITTISVDGGSWIDSFDSTLGDYSSSNKSSQAMVATNSIAPTSNSATTISVTGGSSINGNVYVGPGATASRAVYTEAGSTITGTKTTLSQALSMPSLSAPTGLGASTGGMTCNGGRTYTVSTNQHLDSLTIGNGAKLQISGNVTMLVEGAVSITSNIAALEILPGASLSLYFKGAFTISNGGGVAVDGQNLSRMKFNNLGTTAMTFGGGTYTEGVVLSPGAAVNLSNGAFISGAVTAISLSVSGGSALHEDKRITTHVDPVTQPSALRIDSWTRSVQ